MEFVGCIDKSYHITVGCGLYFSVNLSVRCSLLADIVSYNVEAIWPEPRNLGEINSWVLQKI